MIPDLHGTDPADVAYRLDLTRRAYDILKPLPEPRTKRDFANLLGISEQKWWNWTHSANGLPVQGAHLVKAITGYSLEWLYAGDMRLLDDARIAAIRRLVGEDAKREAEPSGTAA
jgi:hypothetical protein